MKRRMAPWGAGFGSGCSSDSAAMASGPPDVTVNQEPAEAVEECSGKKKSKFQTFKKFFARKKRKDPPAVGEDAGLKASQSSDNVSKTSENNTLTRSEKDKGSGSKISLGSKALSHDSVFVSDSSEANEALGASQDSIHGKVKSLQLQLKQAIRLGSPPSLMCVKKTEDGGTMSEDDGLPCSPPEYTTLHTVMNQPQRNSSNSIEGMDSDDDQLSCAASSRAVSPLVVPGDFSQPASPFGCLDNSAAKHKLGLRYKACNKRKPITRLELKAEGDSVVKILNTSITEAPVELEQQKATEVVSDDELKPKVEKEEDEQGEAEQEEEEKEEEEEEEEEKPQHSRQSLLRDKEEREETEDESETEQDVSHARDTSSSPELCLSEEEAPDAQPSPSSRPSSRASSLDSPGATPEPPAGPREYLLDPVGVTYGVEEDRAECDLTLREEDDDDDIQETREEESSFLQEVLSSLKTPLSSCSLGVETEGVVLEIEEEVKEMEGEDVEVEEEGEEVKEEEAELDEPVSYHAAPAGSLLSDQTAEEDEEEEEEVATLSAPCCQDVQEEKRDEEEEEAEEEEEEELVVERFSQHGQKEEGEKEEVEEVKPEDQNETLTGDAVNQPEEEGRGEEESEGEEEAIELEEEPEVEEEGREKMEEDNEDVEEAKESVEEAEEAIEEEKDNTEEIMEVLPGAEGQEVSLQEADEGVDVAFGDVTVCTQRLTKEDEIPAELGDQVLVAMHETSSQSFEEEREERVEEGVEINHMVPEMDQEDDAEENQPDEGQSDQDVEQDGEEISHLNTKQVEKDQTEATEQAHASSKPSPLSLPESHHETPSQDSGAITPSKTSTTTLHINLISPSSEKVTSFFQQSPTAAYPNSETPSHALAPTVQNTASTEEEEEEEEEEEPADTVETVEALGEEATPPTSVEETAKQLSSGSDQSKVRFTIAPAWQRSLSVEDVKESLTSPSSPPACTSSLPEMEATTKKDPEVKAEPASSSKVEVVLSPGRGWNAGITTAKPQSNATTPPSSSKPQTSAAASTEESSVVVEGNPDNPFGVRLRKTSVLHRFSSEEESPEHPTTIEPPAQPPSCKVDAPQPISAKPSMSQPVSSKPALPKKPDVHGDSAAKNKRISDPAAARGVSAGSDSPSWISVAKQKQKIYKENSVEEITVKKEEQEKKSPLPTHVSSAVSRESSSKVSPVEISKPSVSVEKEARRALSPSAPVPSQPPKTQSLPCSVLPKPQVPPTSAKPQRSLSPPTPVPVAQKSPSCTNPPSLPKTATSSKTPQAQSTTVTSPPFSSRTAPEKSASRAPGLSSQNPSSQRGMPPPALPQDEPPWMALAKKKAKAWSEMPQIVQ
ncbi:probable serine/threonine-protein kinase kinX isoform X2 [Larimichthys crocea]|uniref:probable serine/threonine-protein kinase kinX isoform X2 n=1 Tax=Larimichthys crocea TaxID=215358 RepID=UPI000F5E8BE3|nr:probable serine/threonine-protein kinase kinX isoform X2 [Larimichthys crocea]